MELALVGFLLLMLSGSGGGATTGHASQSDYERFLAALPGMPPGWYNHKMFREPWGLKIFDNADPVPAPYGWNPTILVYVTELSEVNGGMNFIGKALSGYIGSVAGVGRAAMSLELLKIWTALAKAILDRFPGYIDDSFNRSFAWQMLYVRHPELQPIPPTKDYRALRDAIALAENGTPDPVSALGPAADAFLAVLTGAQSVVFPITQPLNDALSDAGFPDDHPINPLDWIRGNPLKR